MTNKNRIQLFEQKQVRTIWDDEQEKWYFSIVDVIGILTDSVDPTAYWRKLKQRLKAEGNETVTNCHAVWKRVCNSRHLTLIENSTATCEQKHNFAEMTNKIKGMLLL